MNNDVEKYCFYQCIIDNFKDRVTCHSINKNNYTILDNSRLLTINKNIPKIIHKPILYFKMVPSILSTKIE